MSFNFEWPSPFSPSFHAHALSLLTSALNRGPKPKVIADDIEVTELNMGSVPPDLEILEIGELGRERFRGIFRLTYAGDAHVVVQTRVQVNPLSGGAAPSDARASTTSEETFTPFASGRGILFAATPLIVPMRLTLSHVRLRAIIVLVVSKSKGITLVFKNDPLESVQVSSTFDSVAVVAKYLQQEIEGQLKEVFREDLPGIIHRLSQTWLSGRNKASEGKVAEDQAAVAGPSKSNGTRTRKRSSAASVPAAPPSQSPASPKSPHKRPPAAPRSSSAAPPSRTKPTPRPPSPPTADVPPPLSDYYQEGADSYDPTYGLREDEVRVPKDGRGFKGLKGLRRSAMDGFGGVGAIAGTSRGKGLGGLLDDDAEEHEEQAAPQDTREAADEQDQGEMVQPAGEEEEGNVDEAEDDGLVDQEADAAEVESEEEGTQSDADDVDDEDPGQENRAPATSDDFSRFGYPPPDAEFNSEAFELASMAPRSIFDDDGRDAPSRSKTIKSNRGPRSTRSAGNASAAAQRINARRSMGTQAAPAISRHPTAPAPTLLMPGLTRSNSSASSSILSGRSPLLASTGPGSSVASHRTSPANTGGRVTPASSSSSSAAAAGPSSRPRPRVFHSSSLLQLYQPSSDGIDNGDETTSSSWGGGSATIRGARSSRLSGGGGSTLRPPRSEGGRSTAHDGSESGFASDASPGGTKAKARRMFQLAGKGKQAETPQPPTTPPEEVDRRFFHQMSLSEDDEEEEDSAGDVDDVDDVDSDEQTHSRTHSLSNSGESGTLATLEPEALPSDYSSHWGGRR